MVPREAYQLRHHINFIGAPPFNGAMAKHICIPKSQILALPETMDVLEPQCSRYLRRLFQSEPYGAQRSSSN
jgi:hypothetical protein